MIELLTTDAKPVMRGHGEMLPRVKGSERRIRIEDAVEKQSLNMSKPLQHLVKKQH